MLVNTTSGNTAGNANQLLATQGISELHSFLSPPVKSTTQAEFCKLICYLYKKIVPKANCLWTPICTQLIKYSSEHNFYITKNGIPFIKYHIS